MQVTIVLCCYNKENYIADAIESVLNQSSKDWHLIIIDDCSLDSSSAKLQLFSGYANVTIVRNKTNHGANYCRNLGLDLCSTELIMFLDGDDILEKKCVERRLATAKEFEDANLLLFTMGVFKNKIGDRAELWLPEVKDPLKNLLSHKLTWSIVQPLWKTEFLRELKGFDLTFKRLQDVELNTRALLHKDLNLKMFNQEPDCYYRIDPKRINYDLNEFLNRWVDASVQYVEKFISVVPISYRKFLRLTLFQTYLQIIYYKKNENLSEDIFFQLQQKLKDSITAKNCLGSKAWLFSVAYFFNVKFKVPGVNFLIRKVITV